MSEGGVGLIVNARTGERGVYLHMQLNHNYSHTTPDGSPTSFIRLYLAANNNETNSYIHTYSNGFAKQFLLGRLVRP